MTANLNTLSVTTKGFQVKDLPVENVTLYRVVAKTKHYRDGKQVCYTVVTYGPFLKYATAKRKRSQLNNEAAWYDTINGQHKGDEKWAVISLDVDAVIESTETDWERYE